MTVDLVREDMGLPAVQHTGRWKSPEMVARYTWKELAQHNRMANGE